MPPARPSSRAAKRKDHASSSVPSLKVTKRTTSKSEKNDEELELESFLFGRKRKRVGVSGDGKSASLGDRFQVTQGVEKDGEASDNDGMSEIDDSDLFQMDGTGEGSGIPSGNSNNEEDDDMGEIPDDELYMIDDAPRRRSASPGSDEEDSGSDGFTSNDDEDESDDEDAEPSPASHPLMSRASSSSKKSVWHDPSDDLVEVKVSNEENTRLKKLIRGDKKYAGKEAILGGEALEGKLREQFEKMHPTPEWAAKSTRKGKKSSEDSGTMEERLSSLFSNTASFSSGPSRKGELPKGTLDIDREKDANIQMRSAMSESRHTPTGGIVSVKFHPSVGALAVIGSDRRLRMFSIDGHTNPPLLSLHIPPLPLTTAHFHPSGTSIFLGGPRPFYYTYDLPSQRAIRSPKNLFGVSDTSSDAEKSFEKTAFSPDGSMLAIAGRKGAIYVIAWGSAGAGQLVGNFNRGRSGGVKDLLWMRGGRELWVLGEGNEIDVWDIVQRSCVRRWQDQGGFGATTMKASKDEKWCAVGSSNGIVNVYDSTTLLQTTVEDDGMGLPVSQPKPVRELQNLTTAISTMAFNYDGQILLTASNKKKDSMRLFHLPSATAFTNWPTSSTPLGKVMSADFSAGSEYLAVGNTRGKVLLYSLSHYKS